ncbi:MAG: hypothetical protein PHD07_01490, partial [Bacteroidales bacterium]|nr:hypothetical protein [Bacteroidales bacterium]
GITLLPQAGVEIGMVNIIMADPQFGTTAIANTIRFIVLFGVLIYEIFGPMLTKWSLTKAGEINEKPITLNAQRLNIEDQLN